MPNSYFQFKQFTIQQGKAAMKVCTDSCLLGAWVAANCPDAKKVLDIGTGTGLLSLMYAQENDHALIDAIEMDEAAFLQASWNIQASPWSERLRILHIPLQNFIAVTRYDLIISNPPFFEKDLRSENAGRNQAMHDTSLTLDELAQHGATHLSAGGRMAVLLPYHRSEYFAGLAEKNGLNGTSVMHISQNPSHGPFRSVMCFSKLAGAELKQSSMFIKDSPGNYSDDFTGLLKKYYLYL